MAITTPSSSSVVIKSGEIYRDVVEKRLDNARVEHFADLETVGFINDVLDFPSETSARKAISDGVFLLEIPTDLDLRSADQFAQEFYKGDGGGEYGRFKFLECDSFGDPLLGYHQRSDQIEQFLLERRFWHSTYPPEIIRLAEQLTNISAAILKNILELSGLPKPLYERATGGCSLADGSYHLTFNHYRPIERRVGLSSHKDDGFLTILRTKSPGLEVNRYDRWEMVPARSDHFVINFGLTMEILTKNCVLPVSAIMHRVRQQSKDRTSFGHFSSSKCYVDDERAIYQFDPPGELREVCTSRELIDANDAEIYQGTNITGETNDRSG